MHMMQSYVYEWSHVQDWALIIITSRSLVKKGRTVHSPIIWHLIYTIHVPHKHKCKGHGDDNLVKHTVFHSNTKMQRLTWKCYAFPAVKHTLTHAATKEIQSLGKRVKHSLWNAMCTDWWNVMVFCWAVIDVRFKCKSNEGIQWLST